MSLCACKLVRIYFLSYIWYLLVFLHVPEMEGYDMGGFVPVDGSDGLLCSYMVISGVVFTCDYG
jgi:hypothetical protein